MDRDTSNLIKALISLLVGLPVGTIVVRYFF